MVISSTDTSKWQIQKSEYFENVDKKLTKEELSTDGKLIEIGNFFKMIYLNKLGFTSEAYIIGASKKVYNGVVQYEITYLLKDGKSTLTFSVEVVFNGKIEVKGISEGVRQDLYD